MTEASRITEFFGGQALVSCGFCEGLGLRCIGADEEPELCTWCGGTGLGPSPVSSIRPVRDRRQLRLELGDEPVDDDDDFLTVDPNFLAVSATR